jgi:ATP-dependent Clp protease ATP-binding subunit ClpA
MSTDGNEPAGHDRTTGKTRDQLGTLTERARGRARSPNADRFATFTARARTTLTFAQEEARRLDHDYLGTEHLLLGLLREGEGIAARSLSALGVELGAVRAAIEQTVGRGDRSPTGELGATPRLKRALELAETEARTLKHRYVGTEHLLLGLLREGEGLASGLLNSLGVSLERARGTVMATLTRLGQATADGEPGSSHVVMCRVADRDLAAIDALVETGIRTTRSDAAAWLIRAGIEANSALLAAVSETVTEIRRLRQVAQAQAQQATAERDRPSSPPPVRDVKPPSAPPLVGS